MSEWWGLASATHCQQIVTPGGYTCPPLKAPPENGGLGGPRDRRKSSGNRSRTRPKRENLEREKAQVRKVVRKPLRGEKARSSPSSAKTPVHRERKVHEQAVEGKRDPEMSKPPTAPPPTIVPTNSAKLSANLPANMPAKGSANDSEVSLRKGDKHIRGLVEELYQSGMSQETIEAVTGVPRDTPGLGAKGGGGW